VRILAITPFTDVSAWLRSSGLEIVLLVLGALLLARFVTWVGRRVTERIDAAATDEDALVRSEAAKHRHAVAQVLSWLAIAFIWCVTGVQILARLGVPVASLVAPAAVLGAALGFGAQQLVRASELLRKVGAEAFEDQTLWPLLLDAPTVMGVESLEVGQLSLDMAARTLPGRQFEVARKLRVRVAVAFQREGLVAPAESVTHPAPEGA
jgi:small-conductance mechanosensitive channel